MKKKIVMSSFAIAAISATIAFSLLNISGQSAKYSVDAAATPLGDAFTYQGKLLDGGVPPTATYDIQLTLFDQASGGIQIAGPLTLDNVAVDAGIFTVQPDFGSAAFNGDNRFMAIGLRPGASTGAFTLLTTRTQINATPYALYAKTAETAGTLTSRCPVRKYYLTSSTPNGANADTSCVSGYHFASFAEIMGTSSLEYAQNGVDVPAGTAHTLPDSGMGPPFSSLGFIRIGVTGSNNAVPGNANCISAGTPWNTASAGINGTAIALKPTWTDAPTNVSPWDSTVRPCDNTVAPVAHAWCVQD